MGSVVLGARLDMEPYSSGCRLAFEGRIVQPVQLPQTSGLEGFSRPGRVESKGQHLTISDASRNQSFPARLQAEPPAVSPADAFLALNSLRVVRRKVRVGAVERFVSEGSLACTCGSNPSDAANRCSFQSRSLVVRGLFEGAQHARRFAGFRVALVQAPKDQTQSQLACADGHLPSDLYKECLAVCLPALGRGSFFQSADCKATPTEPNSANQTVGAERTLSVRLGIVGAPFGGKGKCVVELQQCVSCDDARVPGGLGASTHYCVVLMYCKSCFDKNQPLLQP